MRMRDCEVKFRITYGKFSYGVTEHVQTVYPDDVETIRQSIERRWRKVKADETLEVTLLSVKEL